VIAPVSVFAKESQGGLRFRDRAKGMNACARHLQVPRKPTRSAYHLAATMSKRPRFY
jgi:hypothetical protein